MTDNKSAPEEPNICPPSPQKNDGIIDEGETEKELNTESKILKLPSVENTSHSAHDEQDKEGVDTENVQTTLGNPQGNQDNLTLPSVAELSLGNNNAKGTGEMVSNGYAESIILDGDEEGEDAAGFYLPRIEVNPVAKLGCNGGAQPSDEFSGMIPTWNHEFESMVLCRKPRREIVAENAHPNCFGSVGASGLSRIFTSGSFCPELSSRSMVPKNLFSCPSVPPLDVRRSVVVSERAVGPVERSKTIAHIPRSKGHDEGKVLKMPEIRTSKVSLYSRDGERARNLVFVRNARMTRDDRAKSDLEPGETRRTEKQSAGAGALHGVGVMPRLVERTGVMTNPARNSQNAAALRSNAVAGGKGSVKVTVAESESDELTPSEAGIMGVKINDWFNTGRSTKGKDPKPKAHHSVRNKRQSRNIWDPGIGKRIHRGLASSVFKSNACVGNYLNDVTASRFPQVEIRQIVFTR